MGGNPKVSPGTACIFPFRFRGESHSGCTLVSAGDGKPWCSTQVDSRGTHVSGTWAHCEASCPNEGSVLPGEGGQ